MREVRDDTKRESYSPQSCRLKMKKHTLKRYSYQRPGRRRAAKLQVKNEMPDLSSEVATKAVSEVKLKNRRERNLYDTKTTRKGSTHTPDRWQPQVWSNKNCNSSGRLQIRYRKMNALKGQAWIPEIQEGDGRRLDKSDQVNRTPHARKNSKESSRCQSSCLKDFHRLRKDGQNQTSTNSIVRRLSDSVIKIALRLE